MATPIRFVGVPLMTARTGVAFPVAAFDGICTSIIQTPTIPGASPEKRMFPKVLPIATQTDGCWVRQLWPSLVGAATVFTDWSDGAAAPSANTGLTGPWPVPYSRTLLPRAAGLEPLFAVPSWFRVLIAASEALG